MPYACCMMTLLTSALLCATAFGAGYALLHQDRSAATGGGSRRAAGQGTTSRGRLSPTATKTAQAPSWSPRSGSSRATAG